jgi:hypothetical protein
VRDAKVDRAVRVARFANLEVVVEDDRKLEPELSREFLDRGFEIGDDDPDVIERGVDHLSSSVRQMMEPCS